MSIIQPTEEKPPKFPPRPAIEIMPLQQMLDERGPGEFQRGSRPRDHLYASELGHCPRSVWLEWHHPRPRDETFSRGRGALGHAVEHLMKENLRPFLVADEVTFRDEMVSGRADFFLRLGKGYPQFPAELKTTLAYDRFCSEPMREHVLQLQWYLSQEPSAPYGVLIYYNLSGWGGKMGEWKALVIPRDDTGVSAVAKKLWAIVHQSKEPECEEPGKCFWCDIAAGTEMKPV